MVPAVPGLEVGERLARVGEVSVHRAVRLVDARPVRLTYLALDDPPTPEQEERQQRFLEDGERLLGARSEALLHSFDLGEAAGGCWLVQQAVDGVALRELIESAPTLLEVPVALALGISLGEALAALELVDLVHRDIGLDNLLIDREGRARLVGFGLNVESSYDRLSAGQAPLTSVDFLSPEQVEGDLPLTPKTDVYGLGATLFRCLCGRAPHAGATLFTRLRSIAHEPPPDLRALRPEVPDGLAEVLGRCLEWDADDRPLARDLAPLLRIVAREYGLEGEGWERQALAAWVARHLARRGPEPRAGALLRLIGTDRALERPLGLGRPIEVGRSNDSEISLRFGWISRRHARIELGPDGVVRVTDLRSANGTSLNRERIQGTHPLKDDDLVTFGKSTFEVTVLRGDEVPGARSCELCTRDLTGALLETAEARLACQERLEQDRAASEARIVAALAEAHFEVVDQRGSLGLFRRYRANRRKRTFLVSAIELGARNARRFADASQKALLLKHRAILPVLDIDVRAGTLIVVCQDRAAETLGERVAAQGPMRAGEVAALGGALADALDAALREGVCGFVRPDLLLIGDDGAPALLDLGLAPGLVEAARKRPGLCVRPCYLAPEAPEVNALTPAGVVYGLGGTLVYALTGQPPAEERAGERYDYLPVSYVPGVSRRLASLLARCTALDPSERPQSPGSLVLDFEGLTADTAPPRDTPLGEDDSTRPPGT
ncbi:MAG: protein kinase [Planctomycetota bacterium]